MGRQWHQLHHTQIICTSLQTDNHASTSPLSFYRPGALPAAQPTEKWLLKMVCKHAMYLGGSGPHTTLQQFVSSESWL